jgi:hypothetical protein
MPSILGFYGKREQAILSSLKSVLKQKIMGISWVGSVFTTTCANFE